MMAEVLMENKVIHNTKLQDTVDDYHNKGYETMYVAKASVFVDGEDPNKLIVFAAKVSDKYIQQRQLKVKVQ